MIVKLNLDSLKHMGKGSLLILLDLIRSLNLKKENSGEENDEAIELDSD